MQTDRPLALALVVFCVGACLLAPAAGADGTFDAPTSAVIGGAPGVVFVQFDGIFSGRTSTGAYRVPYRITIPAPPARTNGTVVVEPPHFALGLGALEQLLGLRFLLSRGFAHAGIGWSTASFGDGLDLRILDPGADRVFVDGGVADGNGRTDDEIVVDFARSLTRDGHARAMLGRVDRRYLTGFSDSSGPVLRLVASGRANEVFDFVLPVVAEGHESRSALAAGRYLGKVIVVDSEVEAAAAEVVDNGVPGSRSRSYAVAGTAHMPDFLGFPSFTTMSTPASFEPELRAHFLHGHRWVVDRKAP
ncbi:MAG TPA: alpha/beta hydrolase domain-containing protein, partial [Desertimonas sp.]|nr:alpha/beta hydrolase domain-containing protein [Desertimonas sp.]